MAKRKEGDIEIKLAPQKDTETKPEVTDGSLGKRVNVTKLQPGDAVIFEIMRKTGKKEFYLMPPYKLLQFENVIYEWNENDDYLYIIRIQSGTKSREYPANRYYEGNPKAQPERAGLYPSAYVYKDYLLDGRALLQRLELAAWDIKEWKEGSKERLVTELNMKWIVIALVVVAMAVIAAVSVKGGF